MLIATQVFMLIACLIEMWATNWTHWIAAKVLNVSHADASADDRVFLWDVIKLLLLRTSPRLLLLEHEELL
jgi:uncharacterized membrane protein